MTSIISTIAVIIGRYSFQLSTGRKHHFMLSLCALAVTESYTRSPEDSHLPGSLPRVRLLLLILNIRKFIRKKMGDYQVLLFG